MLVLTTALTGTAALAASSGGSDLGMWIFVLGPAVLGVLTAIVAAGRARFLALGAAVFLVITIAWLIALGDEGRVEGGGAVGLWVLGTEIAALYATAGVIWLARSRAARGRASSV